MLFLPSDVPLDFIQDFERQILYCRVFISCVREFYYHVGLFELICVGYVDKFSFRKPLTSYLFFSIAYTVNGARLKPRITMNQD